MTKNPTLYHATLLCKCLELPLIFLYFANKTETCANIRENTVSIQKTEPGSNVF